MNIEMKVSQEQSEFNPAQLQKLRRVINVLCDAGFEVDLAFKNGDRLDSDGLLPNMSHKYQGGSYYDKGMNRY